MNRVDENLKYTLPMTNLFNNTIVQETTKDKTFILIIAEEETLPSFSYSSTSSVYLSSHIEMA